MAPPAIAGTVGRIVVGEIILGEYDAVACRDIAGVFITKSCRVIFNVIEHVQRMEPRIVDEAQASLVTFGQNGEAAILRYVFAAHFGPAGDGDREVIGEAAQVRRGGREVVMMKHSKGLLREGMFGDAVKVMHGSLRGPTDVQAAMDVGLGPIEDAAELIPVSDLFKGQMFDGGLR